MKDSLKDLFRERFQGHEAPVDPATWQVIEARMLTSAPATDNVNELFRERFQQHEVSVDPGVWQGISSQLGHGAAAGGGLFGGFGWVAAGIAGLVVVGGLVIALSGDEKPAVIAEKVSLTVAPSELANPTNQLEPAPAVVLSETPKENGNMAASAVGSASPAVSDRGTTPVTTQNTSGNDETSPEHLPTSTTNPRAGTEPEGAQLVNTIIADISEEVEEEVRASYRETSSNDPGEHVAVPAETPADPDPASAAPGELQKPFMPSVFTPNNDGINDVYVVPMEGYTSLLLRVYSMKSNQLVFSTNSGEPWTGANCEDGMYLVAVEAMAADGRLVSEGKVVWLNRAGMN